MICHLFDREMWSARIMTMRCAEKYGDWKWLGQCLLGAWRKVWFHMVNHFYGFCSR